MATTHKPLGVFPKIPTKTIPGTNVSTDGTNAYQIVLSEQEKEENNYERIKKLVYHYEWISRQQINTNRDKILKLFNMAYGVIDVDDYIKTDTEYKAELSMLDGEELDYDLKFFPIIPNIVNAITGQLSNQYVNYSAIAHNREATNEVLELKNQTLRDLLIQPLQEIFNTQLQEQGVSQEDQPDVYEEQLKLFQEMPKVQKYYSKDFRLEVEKWANHQMNLEDKKFNMKTIEKQLFFNKIVTDYPYLHIDLMDDDYRPKIIDPRYAAYLRSPYTDDISDAIMFHWFEYESPLNLIGELGSKLREEDVQKLERLHIHFKTLLTMDSNARYNLDTPGIIESAQNYLAFREVATASVKDTKYRHGEYKERLIEVSNMYLQVPRKLGKLTIASEQGPISTIVDDTYTTTYPPTYDQSFLKEKSERTLVQGEHIEWFYINELWRCKKINLSANPNPDNSDDIWVILEKYPIQLPKLGHKYGSYIPVHGGPKTNKYNESVSIVKKCYNWQVFYNFLWNRNEQKLQGEIGKFYAMNHNIIPQESMGEEWGQQNIVKWALTARDTGIGVTDTSLGNTGQSNLGLTGGYGQVIDLTVTQEILEKAKLAEICKNEMLQVVGLTPQFLADISPSETATGITQGISRGMGQIKYLFDEHYETMQRARQTMLECAKYIALQNNSADLTYMNDEGERVIFQMDTSKLPLTQLGIFVTNSIDDTIMLEQIRQYVLSDNTIGADVFDKLAMITSKSVSGIYSKLKEADAERQKKEQERMQQEQAQQQSMIDSQEQQLQRKLEFETEQKRLDRESEERITEMKVIGQAQFSEGNGYEELLKIKELQEREKNSYMKMMNDSSKDAFDRTTKANQTRLDQESSQAKFDLEREKLQVQKSKILADLKRSQNEVLIAKVNKN